MFVWRIPLKIRPEPRHTGSGEPPEGAWHRCLGGEPAELDSFPPESAGEDALNVLDPANAKSQ